MIEFKGRQIPETLAEIVDPAHTALVVHELLNDFSAKGGWFDKAGHRIDASSILPATIKLIASARAAGIRVIYVRYTRHRDYSSHSDPVIRKAWPMISENPDNNMVLATIEGTWGWEFLDEVKPEPDDLVLRKYRPDAFFGTTSMICCVGTASKASCWLATAPRLGLSPPSCMDLTWVTFAWG